jgi:hypothetical protein
MAAQGEHLGATGWSEQCPDNKYCGIGVLEGRVVALSQAGGTPVLSFV